MKAKSALIASIGTMGIASYANAQDFTSAGGTVVNGFNTVDLVIGSSGTIQDLDATLNWQSHGWVGDLHVTLQHVDTGTTVTIHSQAGSGGSGSPSDLAGLYRYDDESANSFSAACDLAAGGHVANGTYFASDITDAQTFLSAFDGEDINGTWRLSLTDNFPGSGDGVLTNFTLHMVVPAPGALGLLGAAGIAGLGRRRSRR